MRDPTHPEHPVPVREPLWPEPVRDPPLPEDPDPEREPSWPEPVRDPPLPEDPDRNEALRSHSGLGVWAA